MKSFASLFTVFFKARLLSISFAAVCAVLAATVGCFALLCPAPAPASARVGLIFPKQDTFLADSCRTLLESEEITFVSYPWGGEEQLRRDVISGLLHCGYKIDPASPAPITVFESDGSYLTPVLDELVFAAWYEAHMLKTAPDAYGGKHRDIIASELERALSSDKPLTADITVTSAVTGGEYTASSLSPLMYAVMIPLCLLSAAFCAMLTPGIEREAISLLPKSRAVVSARFLANAAAFLLPVLLCEAVISLSIQNSFSPPGRMISALMLALLSAAVFAVFSRLRGNSIALLGFMLWAACSVITSGAVISPSLLGGFEWLKFLSPSYLLLGIISAF